MKPFDLEAAKRGEPICWSNGKPCSFVGVTQAGHPVVEYQDGGISICRNIAELYMVPKKHNIWVNFYAGHSATYYGTQQDADKCSDFDRVGGRAYPVEIAE